MLSSISWNQYIMSMAALLTAYYLYVGYKYFRWEILALIGISKVENSNTSILVTDLKKQFTGSNHADHLPKETNVALQPFMDEVIAYLGEPKPAVNSEEIVLSMKAIAEKYPVLLETENKIYASIAVSNILNEYYPGKFLSEDIQHIIR